MKHIGPAMTERIRVQERLQDSQWNKSLLNIISMSDGSGISK